MDTPQSDLTRLSLLVQRILDADVLGEPEGDSLLVVTEEARRSLREGDTEAARRYVERIALFTEALIRTEALDLADGQAVVETARRILAANTD